MQPAPGTVVAMQVAPGTAPVTTVGPQEVYYCAQPYGSPAPFGAQPPQVIATHQSMPSSASASDDVQKQHSDSSGPSPQSNGPHNGHGPGDGLNESAR